MSSSLFQLLAGLYCHIHKSIHILLESSIRVCYSIQRSSGQHISNYKAISWNMINWELESHHPHLESLHSNGHFIQILGTEERNEWFVICFDAEYESHKVIQEAFACPCKGKCFFLDLCTSLFRGCQRFWDVCNRFRDPFRLFLYPAETIIF